MTEDDILQLIEHDPWMMQVITTAAKLNLPDWMIGAGFVRNKVWDHSHDFTNETVQTPDIDLIYFDPSDIREETEKAYDAQLEALFEAPWSTKNQARMHVVNGFEPFTSSEDGLAHWVETPTCVAVTMRNGALELVAPHGITDLVNLIVRPTPAHKDNVSLFNSRVSKKRWLALWPKLRIER